MLLFAPLNAAAATRFSDGVSTFEKTEAGTAMIVECNLNKNEIEVPGQVLGYTVTEIGDYAFMEYSGVVSVTLPESVASVGEYAFAETFLGNMTEQYSSKACAANYAVLP